MQLTRQGLGKAFSRRLLSSALLLFSMASLQAVEVKDLYVADVSAAQSQQQWQRQALEQVLLRVSGQADLSGNAAVRSELDKASGYIKQFEAVRHEQGNRMRVLLDAARVNALLQQQQLPVWGAHRPQLLLWIVEQSNSERTFVRRTDDPLLSSIKEQFQARALPVMLPLYDMDDVMNLSETDVWAGFWQQIDQASSRYNADIVLIVLLDSSNGQIRLSWQRERDGRILRNEAEAGDKAAVAKQFADALAVELTQEYATVFAGDTNQAVIEVAELNDFTDIVMVQRILQQILGVAEVTLTEAKGSTARFTVQLNVGTSDFLKALQFERRLRVLSEVDSEYPSEAVGEAVSAQPVASYRYIRP